MDRLSIYEIEFHGHCGVTEEERTIGQRLSIDVEMEVDLKKAAGSDRLEETVDYDRLCGEIVKIGRESRVLLIETLAERVAAKVLQDRRIASVTVRVRKCLPPREEIQGGVEVEIFRSTDFGLRIEK
ncbi:MAG: dihydroneopterin aldolase [Candidatus Manganitrophaceae bacterium]|nr:MAG: dihydroneopterin aldolase [Candidatus Manganitrophaceae bacterium]